MPTDLELVTLPGPIKTALRAHLRYVGEAEIAVDEAKDVLKAAQKNLAIAQADLNAYVRELTEPMLPLMTASVNLETGEIGPGEPL